MNVLHRIVWLLCCPLLPLAGTTAYGQTLVDVQYQRKAEMLCPLGKILLPDNALDNETTFRIGVLGGDPFQGTDALGNSVNFLDEMATQRGNVRGRRIVILRFLSARDVRPCHMLFISSLSPPGAEEHSSQERLAAILKRPRGGPCVLTADAPDMAEAGVAVNFFLALPDPSGVSRVSFEVNPDAAKRAGLTVDPGLLRLASRVVTDRPIHP